MQTLVKLDKEVTRTLNIARTSFPKASFPEPTIKMDLVGKNAGVCSSRNNLIRFNLELLLQNKDDFIHNTVPHEVAHYVTDILAPHSKPHGSEWKAVMKLFGVSPTVYHDYEVVPPKHRKRPYLYRCACQDHYFTKLLHKRVQSGVEYTCKDCNQPCKYFVNTLKGEG